MENLQTRVNSILKAPSETSFQIERYERYDRQNEP